MLRDSLRLTEYTDPKIRRMAHLDSINVEILQLNGRSRLARVRPLNRARYVSIKHGGAWGAAASDNEPGTVEDSPTKM